MHVGAGRATATTGGNRRTTATSDEFRRKQISREEFRLAAQLSVELLRHALDDIADRLANAPDTALAALTESAITAVRLAAPIRYPDEASGKVASVRLIEEFLETREAEEHFLRASGALWMKLLEAEGSEEFSLMPQPSDGA